MHVHAHPDDESSKGAASTARYVAEGVDVHVVTCTGGERGSILNPKMERPDILENITEVRRQEMERARDILGVTPGLARLRRLRLARGRPEAAAARGLLRAGPRRGGGRAAGPADPRASGPTSSRRTTSAAATRTPTTSRATRSRSRRSRRPATRSATPTPGSRGSRSSSTTTTRSTGRGCRRSTTRCSPTAWSRRGGSGSRSGSRSPSGTPGSPPGCRAPTTSGCATRRCWPTRPRSTPTATGSPIPRELQEKVWPTEDFELVDQPRRRTDPGGRPVRGHPDARADAARLRQWRHAADDRPARWSTASSRAPKPEDVKAGWVALVVFLLLCAAVVFLGFSLVKQLRKAQAAKDAGVYGDEPVDRTRRRSPSRARAPRPAPTTARTTRAADPS